MLPQLKRSRTPGIPPARSPAVAVLLRRSLPMAVRDPTSAILIFQAQLYTFHSFRAIFCYYAAL